MVNECGKADIWPVLAQSASWGYGASGTHGFGAVLVKDRFHAGGHGQYFEPEFVEKYWEPFIRRGEYKGTEFETKMPPTPWWISVLGILPFRWTIVITLMLIVSLMAFMLHTRIGSGRWEAWVTPWGTEIVSKDTEKSKRDGDRTKEAEIQRIPGTIEERRVELHDKNLETIKKVLRSVIRDFRSGELKLREGEDTDKVIKHIEVIIDSINTLYIDNVRLIRSGEPNAERDRRSEKG